MNADLCHIRIANNRDISRIQAFCEDDLFSLKCDFINLAQVLIAEEDGEFCGYLQYGLFKNRIPFMHKLFVIPACRGKGYATAILSEWERLMRKDGYGSVMLTSSALSSSQNYYRLMGYRDIGSFMLSGEPLEMIFQKQFEVPPGD